MYFSFIAVINPASIRSNAQFTQGTLDEGFSALSRTIEKGDLPIAELLLVNGADPNVRNRHGVTALMTAAKHGHMNIVKLLISKGADVAAASKVRSSDSAI